MPVVAQVAAVVKLLYRWGYAYVENLTWVQMAPNNTILTAPSPFAQRSHLTLFIFRKTGACPCYVLSASQQITHAFAAPRAALESATLLWRIFAVDRAGSNDLFDTLCRRGQGY